MIKSNKRIQGLLNKISDLHLTFGVQPNELVEAAFNENYGSFEIRKNATCLLLLMTFYEYDGNDKSIIKMRYSYSLDKRLIRVEQKIDNSQYKKQWDRIECMDNFIKELASELSALNERSAVEGILNRLPNDLLGRVMPMLTIVA